MTIGDRIKEAREKLDISQSELARRLNTTKQTIYKYENNIITNIPRDKIEKLASILDTTPPYLMGWVETEERLVSFYSFMDFIKDLGYFIEPYTTGTCLTRNNKSDEDKISYVEDYIVGCKDNLCINCPKFINSYKINYNGDTLIINFNDYISLKDEVISFIRFKMNDFFTIKNEDK